MSDRHLKQDLAGFEAGLSLSRRELLKLLGGGIIVMFTGGELLAQRDEPELPTDFNAFLRIGEDGKVTLFTGKIEMGQGVVTSLAQMLADELDVPLDSVQMVMGDTDLCPWDMGTFGSMTTRFFGPPESAQAMIAAGISADRVRAAGPGEELEVAGANLGVVLSKTPAVSDVAHLGYIAELAGVKVYDTGDIMRGVTREPSLMEPLRRAAPHIALITTSPTEEEFPDFDEAAELAITIGARVAVPAHYDCFAKRTFDPAPFAERFRGSAATRAEIIPYCGCFLFAGGQTR